MTVTLPLLLRTSRGKGPILKEPLRPLTIDLVERPIAIIIKAAIEIHPHEFAIVFAHKCFLAADFAPDLVEERIDIFDDEIGAEKQHPHGQRVKHRLELAMQRLGFGLCRDQRLFPLLQEADIGDGAHEVIFVIRCRNAAEPRDDGNGSSVALRHVSRAFERLPGLQDPFVFLLELGAILRKHFGFGLADIVGEIAAEKCVIGGIGIGQPPVLIPQENPHRQLFEGSAQQPGLADLGAEKGLVRLELGHIDAQANQHAVFQPLVDHAHPAAIGELLHPFEIGQGKIAQLLPHPAFERRVVFFDATISARKIERLHQRLEPDARLQLDAKTAIELRETGIAINQPVFRIVDDDAGIDEIHEAAAEQQVRRPADIRRPRQNAQRHVFHRFEQEQAAVIIGEALAAKRVWQGGNRGMAGDHLVRCKNE